MKNYDLAYLIATVQYHIKIDTPSHLPLHDLLFALIDLAKKVDEEEIEPKECKHIPHNPNLEIIKCLGCGKKLKAKWEACE